ncbi:uncharacterized protein LOC124292256 [Haliotis rubra]|uniref:uncharacterized protein LOC124292256 n=1 Tax=Haliotis rubra TaxID=36100 RepID=UPI001EE57092|nr:uncharacterized protein LOC124292256 [Haliotis rubra]
MLDGASSSYLDLNVTFGVLQGDFQIAVLVKPGIPSSGTILHLQYAGTQPGIRDVKLTTRSSNVTLSVCDSSSCCDSLDEDVALTADMWHFVIIERGISKIRLMIDDSYFTQVSTCVRGSTSITDAVRLRVGQALDAQDVLRGSITCMAVYDYISTGTDMKLNHISFCQDPVPSQLLFDNEMCLQTPTMRHKYYSLEQANAEPDVGVPAIMTSSTTSLRQCGSLCIATRYCLSFTITGVSSQRECKLYDYVTRDDGLRSKTNTKYYVITHTD